MLRTSRACYRASFAFPKTSRPFQAGRTFGTFQSNKPEQSPFTNSQVVTMNVRPQAEESSSSSSYFLWAAVGAASLFLFPTKTLSARAPNYDEIRKEIEDFLDDENYDDGSYGPVLVRLAWHSAGTYSYPDGDGGSNGANMRYAPEKDHGANAGLDIARAKLEQIKQKYPEISYADLYVLASCVAIEAMGGPKIKFHPGRTDSADNSKCTPDGRLPDAARNADHIRAVFYRMGFTDEEMVALIGGGHVIGRCHTDRSGFDGPWTNSPTTFSNDFFVQLLENKWTVKQWNGPKQYEDPTGTLMMLPTDLELRDDPVFRKYSEKFAKDEDYFFSVFASAYAKLMEAGCADKLCPYAV